MSGFLKLVKLSATTMLDRFDGIQYTFASQCGKIGFIFGGKFETCLGGMWPSEIQIHCVMLQMWQDM